MVLVMSRDFLLVFDFIIGQNANLPALQFPRLD